MQGELLKWTNYWNGWQPRWFILEGGILSYYKSLEDVGQGCKGSVNVNACELSVHPTDPMRLDLSTASGEQYIYVRASCEKERQQWLIAIGSSKACLQAPKLVCNGSDGVASPASSSALSPAALSPRSPSDSGVVDVSRRVGQLKTKKSELRLYCDMILQQVHSIKTSCDAGRNGATVNVEMLDDGSRHLVQTCDTFITTLDEVMVLSEAIAPAPNHLLNGGMRSVGDRRNFRSRTASANSVSSNPPIAVDTLPTSAPPTAVVVDGGFRSLFANGPSDATVVVDDVGGGPETSAGAQNGSSELNATKLAAWEREFAFPFNVNFPSKINGISTKGFIEASNGAISLFDLLDEKAFSPIKIDIQGNIECLQTKFKSDPESYSSLESIVRREAVDKKAQHVTSGCNSLMWLARSLMFIHNFLRKLIESLGSVERCLVAAYEETLSKHHGLVVRSVFSVAIKRSPSRPALLAALGLPSDCPEREQQKFFQSMIVPALASYLDTMELCLADVVRLLKDNGVDTEN